MSCRVIKKLLHGLVILVGVYWGATNTALATLIEVSIDTSSLLWTDAQLAFDFIDGDLFVNNSVTINNFITDGTLGAGSSIGGVTGTLPPGPLTISDTGFFNEFLLPYPSHWIEKGVKMYMHSSNFVFEQIARARYYYLHNVKKTDPVEHVEYHDHRWYKLDRHGKVIRVSMTYYELMQPHST